MLDDLAPARRRLVLTATALVLAGLVVLAVVLVAPHLDRDRAGTDPVAQDAQPPVLLIPGYGGGTTGLDVMAAALRREGRTVTVVPLEGDGTGDLNRQADVVEDAVRQVLSTSARSVDLVGYSAGGVIVRLWARQYDGGSVARRIVTLGSPQHGTDLAALAGDLAPDKCPTACEQLATDSSLIQQLNSGDETPPGPAWVSIWTDDDRVSTPPRTASLTGALDFSVQRVCPGLQLSHTQLPASPVVIAMVSAELGRTMPALPGRDVCHATR
ncbi:MAG TPA: alpha/beta fold hydrolase [Nocardioides sp.]|uniref:esterase/lipase family protein n=1 Tax=Nocardioides sp. TaxID=35761 RepID=UPI002E2F5884|nr:alpha/beta fold hydrolase [Nocardioides sp.]HEX3929434.1 alpha/beta fold hydrolase [Nocardioides sp.]